MHYKNAYTQAEHIHLHKSMFTHTHIFCTSMQVADALKRGRIPDPEPFPCVSLFFSDIIGYTDLCSKLSPQEVMAMLHRLYSRFDAIAQNLDLFKGASQGGLTWMLAFGMLN